MFEQLPFYGVGLATEHESRLAMIVVREGMHKWLPLDFLEFGGEVEFGLDETIQSWVAEGGRALYHMLDFNISQAVKMDGYWAAGTRAMVTHLGARWCTSDIGYWYYGRRLRENMALLHPILSPEVLDITVQNTVAITEALGIPYMPENTPFNYHIGQMELLDFYASLLERANTGMVLDCTHLVQYQRMKSRMPISGLDNFPLDRVIEIHIGGATVSDRGKIEVLEDSHHPYTAPEVWDLVEYVVPRAPNLKAICLEIENSDSHQVEQAIQELMDVIGETHFTASLDLLRGEV